ncbi:hypothetical protein AG0111_0g12110 [Alternaria gaisen]|uniref:Uncharacterized protein n=1 Tax=Alternaria gaisen TaxID=167740 RepID=A0ACB6F545_9PLEO|nr:hypothetical protein AG0111_0g12110 [Alternaria gaisen]
MRLINCSTLQLEEFFGDNIPRYAILSHTWGGEEVSFADFSLGHPTSRSGYRKIDLTCKQAIADGLGYAWVDTCCIDKSSSSELSEAINSMFAWYETSTICYAYLSDVLVTNMDTLDIQFYGSRWFTRGWTLQELLAPRHVIFYDQEWACLGTRYEHRSLISRVTRIDTDVLAIASSLPGIRVGLRSSCVAKRMSWASTRQTTRVEDMAYCLLGIFNINMPLLYGEGHRAFLRLQEEIIRRIDDESILAWGLRPRPAHPDEYRPAVARIKRPETRMANRISASAEPISILASSPKDFTDCADLLNATTSISSFTLTKAGLEIQLPLVPASKTGFLGPDWIGLLNCSTESRLEYPGIFLKRDVRYSGSSVRLYRVMLRNSGSGYGTVLVDPRAAAKSTLQTVTIAGLGDLHQMPSYGTSHRQIIVNESLDFQAIGYRLKTGVVWDRTSQYRYDSVWNPDQKVLTIEGPMEEQRIVGGMIEFRFGSMRIRQNDNFTVFMSTFSNKAIVRKGSSFSDIERSQILHHVLAKDSSSEYGARDYVVYDNWGQQYWLCIKLNKADVHGHRLFELSIDAAGVPDADV